MSLPRALRNLRHLYEQMLAGQVKDTASAARGLLGPAIEMIEEVSAVNPRDLVTVKPIGGDADFVAAIGECREKLRAAGVTISAAEWEAEQREDDE